MGKIKKILETELVGGTQSTDVYPVTSTKAVYDGNNVRLDTILKPATKEAAGLMSPEDKKNIDDKLSKSQGGEIKKPIVVTNDDSDYKTIINPDGSIYVLNKNTNNNVFSLINTNKGVIINNNVYSPIRVNNIDALYDKRGNVLYNGTSNLFYANGFAINNGTNNQILLGDGSTTSGLIRQINIDKTETDYRITIVDTNNDVKDIIFNGATKELAGLMTASDKTKLDDIENTYLPLSGGKMTGTLDIDFTEGIRIIEKDLSPRNTYIGNGRIRIESLDGDTSRVNSKTEIDSNSITTNNATVANKVKANGFLANNNGNDHTAWTTNGGSIDLLNLLSNAAIYVAGGFERTTSIDNTTLIDSPDAIIFNDKTGRFLARKNSLYYAHWNADISKNIASPSRYGIETDNGVVPFNKQTYKFLLYSFVYIATCSNGTCSMENLTL